MKIPASLCNAVICTAVALATGCHQPKGPLSICDVLSKLEIYRGKQIAVRAMYHFTTHGTYLTATSDYNGSCRNIEKQGHTWPAAFYFGVAGISESVRIGEALSNARQLQRIHSRTKGMEPLEIVATFTGVLESRDDLLIIRNKDGSYHGNGYGHAGRFPARLIASDVRDVQIQPGRDIITRNLGWIIVTCGFVVIFLLYLWHCRHLDAR